MPFRSARSTRSVAGMATQCTDCEAKLVRGCFGLMKPKTTPCTNCQKIVCSKCAGDQVLIPFDEEKDPLPLKKSSLKSYCKSCMKEVSVLDYSKSYDVVEPTSDSSSTSSKITLIWVHGGGSSKAMFRPHAQEFAKKGYRSILMDLPGHGTLVGTPLTLDSCADAVKQILDTECTPDKCTHVMYIGGSFGAYTGFYSLSKLKDRFNGAVLIDCGQNVGPDCSLKARLGLWFLRKLSSKMNNKTLMGGMLGTTQKSKGRLSHSGMLLRGRDVLPAGSRAVSLLACCFACRSYSRV